MGQFSGNAALQQTRLWYRFANLRQVYPQFITPIVSARAAARSRYELLSRVATASRSNPDRDHFNLYQIPSQTSAVQ